MVHGLSGIRDVDSPIHQTLACPKATSESRDDSVLSVCDLFIFEVSCMCGTLFLRH